MKLFVIFLSGFQFALLVSLCGAEELPFWELGGGFTSLNIPDYQGSNEQHSCLFPLRYLVYHGQILRTGKLVHASP